MLAILFLVGLFQANLGARIARSPTYQHLAANLQNVGDTINRGNSFNILNLQTGSLATGSNLEGFSINQGLSGSNFLPPNQISSDQDDLSSSLVGSQSLPSNLGNTDASQQNQNILQLQGDLQHINSNLQDLANFGSASIGSLAQGQNPGIQNQFGQIATNQDFSIQSGQFLSQNQLNTDQSQNLFGQQVDANQGFDQGSLLAGSQQGASNVRTAGTLAQTNFVSANAATTLSANGDLTQAGQSFQTTGALPILNEFQPTPGASSTFQPVSLPSGSNLQPNFLATGSGTFNLVQLPQQPEPPIVQAVNVNADTSEEQELVYFTTFTVTTTETHSIVTGTTLLERDDVTTTEVISLHTTRTYRTYVPDEPPTSYFTVTSTVTDVSALTTTTATTSIWTTESTSIAILVSTTLRGFDHIVTKEITSFKVVYRVKPTTISLTEYRTTKIPSTTTVLSTAYTLIKKAYN